MASGTGAASTSASNNLVLMVISRSSVIGAAQEKLGLVCSGQAQESGFWT